METYVPDITPHHGDATLELIHIRLVNGKMEIEMDPGITNKDELGKRLMGILQLHEMDILHATQSSK